MKNTEAEIEDIEDLAQKLLGLCLEKKLTMATAESCTGGGIAAALTSIAGSSQSFSAGLVCYSNRAKMKVLSVERALLKTHGAVSEECARAMAEGARAAVDVSLALSTTGIAGPGGGSAERPVGLIHIAAATERGTKNMMCQFGDIGRGEVRAEAIKAALQLGIDAIA